ncbi:TetR/AcrR family transcriptional regulator [Mycobacterium sp. HM-7]
MSATSTSGRKASTDDLFDAARAEFIRYGFRRTSMDDIARRAGVSSRTIYRRLGDKDEIVRAVVTREVANFLDMSVAVVGRLAKPEERLVACVTLSTSEWLRNDLAQAALVHESEFLLTLIQDDEMFEHLVQAFAMVLAGDDMPLDNAAEAAELILRALATLMTSPSSRLPIGTPEQSRVIAETYFVPILQAARGRRA